MMQFKRYRSALIAALLAVSHVAAVNASTKPRIERTAGTIANMRRTRLTITDRAGQGREFILTKTTRITLDGKPKRPRDRFPRGTIVLNASYDVKTMILKTLDLKSVLSLPPAVAGPVGRVSGEITGTDVIRGTISVREAGKTYVLIVTDETTITRAASGETPISSSLDLLQVGDQAEVTSPDGKTASSIKARSPN